MKIVVLMGGGSAERDVSLATGLGVARALHENGHDVIPLDPSTGARLELEGLAAHRIGETPAGSETPPAPAGSAGSGSAADTTDATAAAHEGEQSLVLAGNRDLAACDAVFVALHGGIGEDGTLQALLDLAGVPYTGSGMLASALAMDKHRAKMIFQAAGIPAPRGVLLRTRADAPDAGALGGFPLVVKPDRQGSSVGVHIVGDAGELPAALDDAFQYGDVIVEAFIPGREVTVGVLGGEPLPVVEIVPEDGFYDYRHKYTKGHTRYEVPADLPPEVEREAQRLGVAAFEALGCAGVARVDFRLSPENRLFCLEVNTVPGMTETSLVPMAAAARGIDYRSLVQRLVELAGRASA